MRIGVGMGVITVRPVASANPDNARLTEDGTARLNEDGTIRQKEN